MKIVPIRIAVDTPHGKVDLNARLRQDTSDLATCRQVFAALDYDLRRLRRYPELVSIYDAALCSGRKPLVIDLGANIGIRILNRADNYIYFQDSDSGNQRSLSAVTQTNAEYLLRIGVLTQLPDVKKLLDPSYLQ